MQAPCLPAAFWCKAGVSWRSGGHAAGVDNTSLQTISPYTAAFRAVLRRGVFQLADNLPVHSSTPGQLTAGSFPICAHLPAHFNTLTGLL